MLAKYSGQEYIFPYEPFRDTNTKTGRFPNGARYKVRRHPKHYQQVGEWYPRAFAC